MSKKTNIHLNEATKIIQDLKIEFNKDIETLKGTQTEKR